MRDSMSHAALLDRLHYDPVTGVFTSRKPMRGRRAGSVCGGLSNGRRQIGFDGRLYFASRLAWFYVHGVWPTHQIDHINGRKDDDRIANLRDVPNHVNAENKRGARGYRRIKGSTRLQAVIRHGGRQRHLGVFDTAEEAHAAYVAAKIALHTGCAVWGEG